MKKDCSIELLRIVAMFFVIFNHTWSRGWTLFTVYPVGSFPFFLYMPIAVFCKFSVPVYFMISGAMLLGKNDTLSNWVKRVVRMIIVLAFITLMYYVYDFLIGNARFYSVKSAIVDYFVNFFSGTIKYNLGFLYSYIVFLLILPLLRKLVKNLNKKYYYYMFAMSLAVTLCVPLIEQLLFIGIKVPSIICFVSTNIVIYPCVGYFLYRIIDVGKLNNKRLIIAWCINFISIIITCIFTFLRIIKTRELDIDQVTVFFNSLVLINSIVIFITFMRFSLTSKRIYRCVCDIGSCTFGVYLFHPFFLDNKSFSQIQDILLGAIRNPMLSELLYCFMVFVICAVLTYILKKIPGIKKIL